MDTRSIILFVVLFLLIVVGMFTFSYLNKTEQATQPPTPLPPVEEPVLYPEITRIDAKHFFQDGVHTFVGELTLPTPCDLLDVTAQVAESAPEQITLDFSVINNAESCIQQLSMQRFLVTATASETASVRARFMGREVALNLIPALPGETPEEFEIFIKG